MSDFKLLVIFDGDCGICRASVNWALDRGGTSIARFVPYQSHPYGMKEAGLTESDTKRAAYVVRKTQSGWLTFRGAAAVNYVLARLPGRRNMLWRFVGRLYYLPGLRQLEDIGYQLVARNRGKLRIGPQVCSVPFGEGQG